MVLREDFPDQQFSYRILERAFKLEKKGVENPFYEQSSVNGTFNTKAGSLDLTHTYRLSETAAPVTKQVTYVLDADEYTELERIDGALRSKRIYVE